jgi:vacuolar-type H+-ATPase subunit C/Vma6
MDVPFDFINAKLRGRRRRVYEAERLDRLTEAASVEQLCAELHPREPAVGRLGLERRLRRDCVQELSLIGKFIGPPLDAFYRALIRRFQIDNAIVLLRLWAGGPQPAALEDYLTELPDAMSLPAGELLASGNPADFLSKLPADLARAAGETLEDDIRNATTASTEMALMRAYWQGVIRTLGMLSAGWRAACSPPILQELTAERVLAVIRAARVYGLSWDRLRPLLAPWPPRQEGGRTPFYVSEAILRLIHSDPSPDRVAAALPFRLDEREAADVVLLEQALWARAYRIANRMYYLAEPGPAVLVAYYYVRRNELRNVTRIAEAVHYGGRAVLTR